MLHYKRRSVQLQQAIEGAPSEEPFHVGSESIFCQRRRVSKEKNPFKFKVKFRKWGKERSAKDFVSILFRVRY